MLKRTLTAITAFVLLSTIAIGVVSIPSSAQAQGSQESANLAKFVALMQYIRSEPTPADVHANNVPQLAAFDSAFSDIYITGFITPFTGETPEQVKARLQSVPEEDRFTAVMVESYRLASNPLLLDIMHILLAQYYVDFFTTTDLGGASAFLNRAEIARLADGFDSTNYAIPAPTSTGAAPPSTRGQGKVDSANLAKFAALMQYIRSQPTPADVHPNNVLQLTIFDSLFSDIYITGFITPFTGETPEQVKARLQSVPAEDRFTAVMVESYRLASNPLLLDIMHILLAQYYVDFFTTTDLGGASDFLNRAEIVRLADAFDSTNYAIPAPSATRTPAPTATAAATATPIATPTATSTPTIAQLVKNVQGGVVQIITITSSGSGFIIDSDGRVVTNQHVVSGNRSVTVRMHDGTEYPASVLGVDAVADLAVVDIAPEVALPHVPLGDSSRVQLGEGVVAMGFPLGFQLGQSMTVTSGIVSAKRVYDGVEHIQTDAAINPGNSGGPLFNRAGQVVGVNTSVIRETRDGRQVEGISFAVAINEVKSRLETLKGSGSPQPVTTPTSVPTPTTPVPTPSAAPTPPPLPAGWDRYRNGVYGFSVDTPPRWTLDEDSEKSGFAYIRAPDRNAYIVISAFDISASDSLQGYAEWYRGWLTEYAHDNSYNVFEITSFGRKREGGKEFYELVYREQSSTAYCVERITERIYFSLWHPDKPHRYKVGTGICEGSVSRYSANERVIQKSFTEWMPYWNATHAFGLNVAPGWILDEETNRENYSAFWTSDQAGVFEIAAQPVGSSETLEDFKDWRVGILNQYADTWETFDKGVILGFGGQIGARDRYIVSYRGRTESKYCVSRNVDLIVLSSYHPEHEYGFLVITGVCEYIPNYDQLDDERWEMIYGFRY